MSMLHKREDDTYYQYSPASLYDTAAVETWLEDSAREKMPDSELDTDPEVRAEELADWCRRWEIAMQPQGETDGLDALWWGRVSRESEIMPGLQCAVALRGRCVLAVEYQGSTDLRGAAAYFSELLEGRA